MRHKSGSGLLRFAACVVLSTGICSRTLATEVSTEYENLPPLQGCLGDARSLSLKRDIHFNSSFICPMQATPWHRFLCVVS